MADEGGMNARTPPAPLGWPLSFVLVLSIWGAFACSSGLEQAGTHWQLWDESGEELRRLPAVARLHLRGVRQVALEDFWMVQGEVSAATGKKLAARDVPAAVSGKRLPLSVWTAGDEIVLAPGTPLEAGGVYTLIALGVGAFAELRAADEPSEIWTRWGGGAVRSGARIAYCRMNNLPVVEFASDPVEQNDPVGHGGMGGAGAWSQDPAVERGLPGGLFATGCISVPATDVAGGAFIPPPSIDNHALDPQAVWVQKELSHDRELSWEDQPLGQGCAGAWGAQVCPRGAALLVTNASRRNAALEIFDGTVQVGRVALSASVSSARLGPVQPGTDYTLRGVVFDENDVEQHRVWSGTVRTGPGQAQFVITEVMADPTGPEPQGEWIELQNVGTIVGSLSGFSIGDESGWSALPDVALAPGQFGLIVRRDFAISVPTPAATAVPLWVEELGGNGLRNSGELVQLRGPDGSMQSTMLAKKTPEGISLARNVPWAPDEMGSFASHGAPGASPGADNEF